MITYVYASLFESPAQTLVNTVNTVGVMGKGIAKSFKERYPTMFVEYKRLCQSGGLGIGKLHVWRSDDRVIVNFPTKTTWKRPSQLQYIESGLSTFVQTYRTLGISSVAFPPLGCGNGELDWDQVRPLMEAYLSKLDIAVYIHNIHFGPEFVPEHREPAPKQFDDFKADVLQAINDHRGRFATIDGHQPYTIQPLLSGEFEIVTSGRRRETVPPDEIERAWVALRDGILSVDRYGDERSRRYKSYLFPVFASLPYVRTADVQRADSRAPTRSIGLFFERGTQPFAKVGVHNQGWLFQ